MSVFVTFLRGKCHGLPGLNELFVIVCPHDINGLNELCTNGLNELSTNSMKVISINICSCDIRGMNELSVNGLNKFFFNVRPHYIYGLNELSVNFRPRDVKEYGDITSENGLQVLNGINGTLPESAQE